MYFFNGYIFDSNRLLIYKVDSNSSMIDLINSSYDNEYKASKPQELFQVNPDKMHMNRIAINQAGICLTYNCNLRCRYCGYSSNEQDTNKLQLDDIKLFIKDIIMRRTIKKLITKKDEPLEIDFTGGGEPTYEWNLFEQSVQFIRHQCAENNIPLTLKLTTNGILSNEQIDFISHNFNHIMVSYDGIPETQNRNRISPYRSNTSAIVENSIRQIVAQGVPLTIRSTIWQDDFDRMIEMYHHIFSLTASKGVVTWSIYPVLYEGRAVSRIRKQEETTYGDFFNNYIKLVNYIISKEGEEKLKTIDVQLFNNNICGIFCGAYRINQPWLLPNRSIVTCIESKEDKVAIGEIRGGKLEYYENYQDCLLKIIQKKYTECQNCIAYGICKGGCPIWHLRVDNKIREPLECCLQKEYWKYVINALIVGEYSLGWKLERITLPNVGEKEIYKVTKETI